MCATVDDPGGMRKQVYDLTLEDLRRFAVWEFALDEEGEEGHDEETVRPCPDVAEVHAQAGLFVVATSFTAADGSPQSGFATPHDSGEAGYVQPTIVAETGHVRFWCGSIQGKRKERELAQHVADGYQVLGKSAEALFPLEWKLEVAVKGAPSTGVLPGFGYLRTKTYRDAEGVRRWDSSREWAS
jgi:hypothetical protein